MILLGKKVRQVNEYANYKGIVFRDNRYELFSSIPYGPEAKAFGLVFSMTYLWGNLWGRQGWFRVRGFDNPSGTGFFRLYSGARIIAPVQTIECGAHRREG